MCDRMYLNLVYTGLCFVERKSYVIAEALFTSHWWMEEEVLCIFCVALVDTMMMLFHNPKIFLVLYLRREKGRSDFD